MRSKIKLKTIDSALAASLTEDRYEQALLRYLSLASRQGHLAVAIHEDELIPNLNDLYQQEEIMTEADDGSLVELADEISSIRQGAKRLSHLATTAANPYAAIDTPICQWNNQLFLQRNWTYETVFLRHFLRIKQSGTSSVPVQELSNTLTAEQVEAVKKALSAPIAFLCGGPGTGKTFTAGAIIKAWWQSLTPEQRKTAEIALAAPTGKAAAQLERSIAAACQDLEGFTPLKGQTLHALLDLSKAYRNFEKDWPRLSADLVLIDESSMLDIRMMAHLFAALKEGAKILFLGDPHQLPPVENGSPFADLVAYYTTQPEGLVAKLTQCKRAELKEIVQLAETIDQGDPQAFTECLNKNNSVVIRLHGTIQEPIQWAVEHFSRLQHVEELRHFCLLTPLRKGPCGVEQLNRQIFQAVKNKHRGVLVLPIMVTKNAPELNLFNGDLGLWFSHSEGQPDQQDYACFSDSTGGVRKIPFLLMPKYELAFCLSVHKSQGSEFDAVCVLMPEGAEVFGREVLYTAVTRAKKKVMLFGEDAILAKAIHKKGHRHSGLQAKLSTISQRY